VPLSEIFSPTVQCPDALACTCPLLARLHLSAACFRSQTSPRRPTPSPTAADPAAAAAAIAGSGAGRALDREDWARAMDAWRGIEQRYGR
jgi:hypothetical protein